MSREVSLIARNEDGLYLIQARDVYVEVYDKDKKVFKPPFKPGEYSFLFPGACSLFGGHMEEGETPTQAFEREIKKEELKGLTLPEELEYRLYDFSTQLDEVYGRVNDAYHGNIPAFLGFGLEDLVPQEALGRARGRSITYRDWLSSVREYNLYIANITQDQFKNVELGEGARFLWVPEEAGRTLVMVPQDKLALLDDFVFSGYPKRKK